MDKFDHSNMVKTTSYFENFVFDFGSCPKSPCTKPSIQLLKCHHICDIRMQFCFLGLKFYNILRFLKIEDEK